MGEDLPNIRTETPTERTIAGYVRTDWSDLVQLARNKQNIEYTSLDGNRFFAKYCRLQEGDENTIEGLENEKKILDKLKTTGVTPRAGEIKYYPNKERPKKARLLIQSLDAISLDHFHIREDSQFIQENASRVTRSVLQAYKTIHEAGVLQIDVNPGNIMLQDGENGPEARLVDFEHGLIFENVDTPEVISAFEWLKSSGDFGLRNSDCAENVENLKRTEIYRIVRTVTGWLLGPVREWKDMSSSFEGNQDYLRLVEEVKPGLEAEIDQYARELYQEIEELGLPFIGGEQAFVEARIKQHLPLRISEATIPITLSARLEERGIHLDKDVLGFLTSALNPDLSKRPSDFSQLDLKSGSD